MHRMHRMETFKLQILSYESLNTRQWCKEIHARPGCRAARHGRARRGPQAGGHRAWVASAAAEHGLACLGMLRHVLGHADLHPYVIWSKLVT